MTWCHPGNQERFHFGLLHRFSRVGSSSTLEPRSFVITALAQAPGPAFVFILMCFAFFCRFFGAGTPISYGPEANQVTPKEHLFIAEYLVSLNAADAYRKAGYSPKGANVEARKILTKPHIAAEIVRQLGERYKRLGIEADALLKRAETILTVDPRELIQHHHGACRYCYGNDHEYHWKTSREFREACKLGERTGEPMLTDVGGYGYRVTIPPKHDCPECYGLGVSYVLYADTRALSPAAQILYEGIKKTRNGPELKMASKQEAFNLLAKHFGLMSGKPARTATNEKQSDQRAKARIVILPATIAADAL
jgi:phage terminase small subunit